MREHFPAKGYGANENVRRNSGNITRRSFFGKTLPLAVMAGAGLSIHQLEKEKLSEQERLALLRKAQTTQDVPEYFAPIKPVPHKVDVVAQMTDGVRRVDREGNPVKPEEREHFRESISWRRLHDRPHFDFEFQDVVPRARTGATPFENPKYDNEGIPQLLSRTKAKFAYASRFRPITDAVERRYNLPRGLLVAMIMQESTGLEYVPNLSHDGGAGLIHMQNSTAHEFGLRVSGNPGKTVDRENGTELLAFIKRVEEDPVSCAQKDDRLNALLNIDAAGRMIASWMSDPEVSRSANGLGPLRRAIRRYCGPNNWPKYWEERICPFMGIVNDPNYEKNIAAEFDGIHSKRTMPDGSNLTFENWKNVHHNYYRLNYNIDAYERLPLLKPENSEQVLRSYQEVIRNTLRKNST